MAGIPFSYYEVKLEKILMKAFEYKFARQLNFVSFIFIPYNLTMIFLKLNNTAG